jgi:ATP adenylyltransferase
MAYIQDSAKGKECVFCEARDGQDGLENLIVHRGRYTYVILNRYPYTSGHLMVVPYMHAERLDDLDEDTAAEMMLYIQQCLNILRQEYKAQGFNVGANIGSAAGAGIPKHFHFHVVPRWAGDTNFLSSIGETRLLPEALEDTFRRVKAGWERFAKERDQE